MPNPRQFGQPGQTQTPSESSTTTKETPTVTAQPQTQPQPKVFTIPALVALSTVALVYLELVGAVSFPWYVTLAPLISYAISFLVTFAVSTLVFGLAVLVKVLRAGKGASK